MDYSAPCWHILHNQNQWPEAKEQLAGLKDPNLKRFPQNRHKIQNQTTDPEKHFNSILKQKISSQTCQDSTNWIKSQNRKEFSKTYS